MNQHTTEVMLELGLKDRMAGTAYLDDKGAPPKYAEGVRPDVLSRRRQGVPSFEALLEAEPDFVYGG